MKYFYKNLNLIKNSIRPTLASNSFQFLLEYIQVKRVQITPKYYGIFTLFNNFLSNACITKLTVVLRITIRNRIWKF